MFISDRKEDLSRRDICIPRRGRIPARFRAGAMCTPEELLEKKRTRKAIEIQSVRPQFNQCLRIVCNHQQEDEGRFVNFTVDFFQSHLQHTTTVECESDPPQRNVQRTPDRAPQLLSYYRNDDGIMPPSHRMVLPACHHHIANLHLAARQRLPQYYLLPGYYSAARILFNMKHLSAHQ